MPSFVAMSNELKSFIPATPYPHKDIMVGHFEGQYRVDAIFMPRNIWLQMVESVLDGNISSFFSVENDPYKDYSSIREEMMDTASTMRHYPVGSWLVEGRGCGCVVGEHLIAMDVIERHEDVDDFSVIRELDQMGDRGRVLKSFGNAIDQALRTHLMKCGNHVFVHGHASVVVFTNDND